LGEFLVFIKKMKNHILSKKNNDLILNIDSKTLSKHLKPNSIDFVVFSPPYWNLRNYNYDGQIGYKQKYEDYLNDMVLVVKECEKVLKDGRFMAINIGTVVSKDGMRFVSGDFVREFLKVGFIFRKDVIWHKPRGTTKWQRGGTQFSQNPYPLMFNTNINHEYILIFQKGNLKDKINTELTPKFNRSFIRKMAYSVWDIRPVNSPKIDEKHVAPYPEELPKRLIQLYTFPGEIVLDPFAGCGTTGKVSKMLGRSSVLIDMSKEYCKLIEKKLSETEFNSDTEDIYTPISAIDDAKEKLEISKKEYEKRLKEYHKLTKTDQKKLF